MNDRDYNRERRKQARLERFGTNNPKCLFCEESDPACLERHHLSGRAFGNDCVIVCRNHHRKLSDKQNEHPLITPGKPHLAECRGQLLLGIADALELLNNPEQLVSLIRQLGFDLIEAGQLSDVNDGDLP